MAQESNVHTPFLGPHHVPQSWRPVAIREQQVRTVPKGLLEPSSKGEIYSGPPMLHLPEGSMLHLPVGSMLHLPDMLHFLGPVSTCNPGEQQPLGAAETGSQKGHQVPSPPSIPDTGSQKRLPVLPVFSEACYHPGNTEDWCFSGTPALNTILEVYYYQESSRLLTPRTIRGPEVSERTQARNSRPDGTTET